MRRNVRRMRQAMAPRLAISIFLNIAQTIRGCARSSRRDECDGSSRRRERAFMRFPGHDANRSRVVGIAGIVELRAIGDQHQHVHQRQHFHVAAGRRDAIGEGQSALRRHRHVHEEIDVAGQVALGHARDRRCAPAPAGSCRGSCACGACPAHSAPYCSRRSRRRPACRAGRRCRRRCAAWACRDSRAARVPVVR